MVTSVITELKMPRAYATIRSAFESGYTASKTVPMTVLLSKFQKFSYVMFLTPSILIIFQRHWSISSLWFPLGARYSRILALETKKGLSKSSVNIEHTTSIIGNALSIEYICRLIICNASLIAIMRICITITVRFSSRALLFAFQSIQCQSFKIT